MFEPDLGPYCGNCGEYLTHGCAEDCPSRLKTAIKDLEMLDRRVFQRITAGRSYADLLEHRDEILESVGIKRGDRLFREEL